MLVRRTALCAEHSWERQDKPHGTWRCAACSVWGYARRKVMAYLAPGRAPKKLVLYVCSADGCKRPAVERAPSATGDYKWDCALHAALRRARASTV